MKAISLIYRTLTMNEFKAINGLIQSQGGGSQTYIDFPKTSISDEQWSFFLGDPVEKTERGYKWKVKVNSLSLGKTQESIEISCRRDTTNSLRDQYHNRIKIWSSSCSPFPDGTQSYTEDNPIIVFIIKDESNQFWAGWFYRNNCTPDWFMNIELASLFFDKAKGGAGYIYFSTPIPFDESIYSWPFSKTELNANAVKPIVTDSIPDTYRPLLTAIRTKPFILLAGISGTGKSRIVRELAFKSCPKYLQDKDHTTPGNYCMIEVKPNWHDSTELLGYYSNINKGYQFKKFVNFLVKAKMFPDVPFFVCLDEMNLAPVEHYFAEILSILETRKNTDNVIKTDVIIEPRYFAELSTMPMARNMDTGAAFSQNLTDREIYMKLFGIASESVINAEISNRHDLTTVGLTLPGNVIIIGTVNMDDTTHQFSRKVIDRAMTIEMNGGNLFDMFGGSKNLDYLPNAEQQKWQNAFKQQFVTADEVLDYYPDKANDIKTKVVGALNNINKALKGTPFEVSYRVLNELTIMVGVMLGDAADDTNLENIINQAVGNVLLMKILPRIEGDVDMFTLSKDFQNQNNITHDNRLEWLLELSPDILTDSDASAPHNTAKDKIKEMLQRLDNQGFTRFWP